MNAFLRLNAVDFEEMLSLGFASLKAKEDEINKLNVFPVPDGDTGSNMRMTYEAGLSALYGKTVKSISEAAALFAKGMLLGARGNSGVILSQIFKGIAIGLDGADEAASTRLCSAFQSGVAKSYKAVIKPVEGTILTVFREATEGISEDGKDMPLKEFFESFVRLLEQSLKATPEKLPVLKEAKVVDSGGAGLLCVFSGFLKFFGGERADGPVLSAMDSETAFTQDGEEFGYCTEFLLKLSENNKDTFEINSLVSRLEGMGGQSIVALKDEDIVKVHVHLLTPLKALDVAQQYGEFITVKIENMTVQHSRLKTDLKAKDRVGVALVAVAGDDGFMDLFYSMGADFVVSGGQSMNPSVEDFIAAFDTVNADEIIVLPNNSNIVLTANQAKDLYKDSRICVVETKSLSQGYSALSLYNPDAPVDETVTDMTSAKDSVISLELTRAVRDAHIDGFEIKKDDCMAIADGRMSGVGKDFLSAFKAALNSLNHEDKSVVTIFCGTGAEVEVSQKIAAYVGDNCPLMEVNTVETNQKIYDYIIAIE